MKSEIVRLFQTLPHVCGYFGDRTSQNLVIDPTSPHLQQVYDSALRQGYRRAGGHVYLPRCPNCRACIAARVAVADFVPDRSQRRCSRRNADLTIDVLPAGFSEERFALYRHYIASRHPGGGMDDSSEEDFSRFLSTDWSPTRFVEFRIDGRLICIAVSDFTAHGLSAVYTFYDPAEERRGLGTFAVLTQIALALTHHLPHLYLGYWIAGHPKMDYKSRFQPLEILSAAGWQRRG
jgi:leucyl-tRNA---protein transferase